MLEEIRFPLPTLAAGEMKQVRAGPTDVLLINLAGTIHAVEPLCPHYKQPLVDGLVCDGKLRCGWHQSVFDVATGDVLEPPALTGLKKYPVRVVGENLFIDVASYRTDRRRFVILGGGAAGFSAVKTLRENGFEGEITLISADGDPPYDRPNLSKDFLAGKPLDTPLPLGDDDFYARNRIDLRMNRRATAIDELNRSVTLSDGSSVSFDKLLIATGASPRMLDITGSQLKGAHTLRSLRDASLLVEDAANASRVVIIGGSFIAIEAAAALRQRGLSVTVVMKGKLPLQSALGDEIATMIRDVHHERGIEFLAEREVVSFNGEQRLHAVTLDDGSQIECGIALVAIGVRPNTDFLLPHFSDLIEPDGGLRVDSHLRFADHIYAAGDITRGEWGRIEHWRFAEQLGRLAAFNMLGQEKVLDDIPYFWTYQFDVALDYLGQADRWDEILIDGNVGKQDFVACYIFRNEIVAVCTAGRSAQTCAIAELMKRQQMPLTQAVRVGGFDYVAALRQICLP